MADYSKEGEAVKDRFVKEFDSWFAGFYGSGEKPLKTDTNPQGKGVTKGAATRAVNSLVGSTDDLNATNSKLGSNLDYVDNRMSKGDSMKSMVGGLRGRVQKATSGSDGARLAVTPYDALHHKNPLGTFGPALRMQNGIIRMDFLQMAADDGNFFAETDSNLAGHSFDPRSHDASVGGASKQSYARDYGERPVRELSAHPRGTADPLMLPQKKYSSGKEMYEAAKPILEQNAQDVEIGKASDAPRRQFLNEVLVKEGKIPEGVDIFNADTDPATIKKAQDFLRSRPDLLKGAAKVWDPKEARKLIKILAGSSLVAVGTFGTGVDAAETGLRTKLAAETKDPVDALQAMISGLATTTGATGIGEALGLPLEVVNMFIDTYREDDFKAEPNAIEARTQQLKQSIKSNPKPTPEPKSEAGYETIGRLAGNLFATLKNGVIQLTR